MNDRIGPWLLVALSFALIAAAPQQVSAHGSITAEDDRCLITMGYLQAHFKIYLPRARQHTEYCEDLPAKGEAVFVMEYLHDTLSAMPIDFRIIRNVTGMGRFARWEDIAAIDDLDAVTVFHQPAAISADVFTVMHDFAERGSYVGIVLTSLPGADRSYTAVFPFSVGFVGYGFWPWFGLFIAFVAGTVWLLVRRVA